MTCKICQTRRSRRACPGAGSEICSVCCGTERENTISCPLECPFLEEARVRERMPELDPQSIPNQDVRITDEFLDRHQFLIGACMRAVAEAALSQAGAVDADVREALDALVRTYRTLQSGLYYESKPANPLAARIHEHVQEVLEKIRKAVAEKQGMAVIRDVDVLGVMVFLERMEIQFNNGRKRGRAFIDFARHNTGLALPQDTGSSSLLLS